MGDPYWRYGASADRAFPGYIPSDASTLSSQPMWPSHNHLSSSSDYIQKDMLASRPGAYGVDDIMGIGVRPEPGFNGNPSVWEDPYLLRRRDVMQGIGPGIPDIVNERSDSLRKADGLPVGSRESNVLFVDALPSDCTRRELSHLFRPFRGFKELRLVHKEPRNSADKAMVLCFVEFSDSNHALTALESLQGYKFDNKKPDSPTLRIHFAHFPFQVPADNAQFPSQPPAESPCFPSQQLTDNTHFPSQPPHDSARFPSQLPPDIARFPSQLPLDSARFSSQPPPDSVHSTFQLPPHREEQGLAIHPREREVAVQDEEPAVMKRKLEGSRGSSQKKPKAEAFEIRQEIEKMKRWCVKCKQKHFGNCYNYKGCFRCGKSGHIGKDCTGKPRLCYGCGEPGHKHSVCPNGPRPEQKADASEET